jgi:rRNA maturation RNase YbeY|tara:strand:- start:194 stop:607 length:414 start_codon:yes stop_codon:yes gene_type:complete
LAITFHKEGVSLSINTTQISTWLSACIANLGYNLGELSIIFCCDEYLLDINKKHLNHDFYTDIITFNYNVEKKLNGDLFISVDRVKDNAILFNENFNVELFRVIIHGVLHLCGFNDKTIDEQKEMRSKENYYLSLMS